MLQTLREKTSGWIAFIILASVGVPFAFFGINNYFETRTESFVARVGDAEISPQEFRERLERLRAQARQTQGEGFDGSYFNDPTVKRQILDRMIEERLLTDAAQRAGAGATDAHVRREIGQIKAFEVEGKFDPNQYRLLLQARGMTPTGFEQEIRHDLEVRALSQPVSESALVSDAEVDQYVRLRDQLRDYRYFFLTPPADAMTAPVSDADIETYYNAHRDEVMTPEQVAIEYVELDASKLDVPLTADDAQLQARYEEQKARFTVNEQRLASHVLIKVEKNAKAELQQAAQAKAATIVAEARAGKDFATLAKAGSDDLGSRTQGGDLGWLEPGMTQPAFDSALFKMQAGEISDPVLTDEGYHVIQLREVRAGSVKPFESVREELLKDFLDGERERVYSDLTGRLTDLVLQNPGSLQQPAEAMKLTLQRTPLFGREGGPGIAANPNVVKAAFSEALLVEGGTSDAVEVGPNHIVVLRVSEHKAKTARPLAEVKELMTVRLRNERQNDALKAAAEALKQKIAGGASFDALAKEANATPTESKGIGRRGVSQDGALVQEVFKLARPGAKPVTAVVALGTGRQAVVELTGVADGDVAKIDAEQRKTIRAELTRNIGATEVRALVDALRARSNVKVVEDRM